MFFRERFLALNLAAVWLLAACGDSPTTSTPVPEPVTDTVDDTTADASPPEDAPEIDAPAPDATPDVAPDAGPDIEDEEDAEEDTADAGDGGDDTEPPVTACRPDQCEIDDACWDNGDVNPDNPCEACLVVVSVTEFSADDDGICDDGDDCTVDDYCLDGVCMGGPSPCDDANPCTVSVCDDETGECRNEPLEGPCDDGDPCTVGDVCSAGSCVAGTETLSCDDGNVCTTNTCEPGTGCVAVPNDGVACDDGDTCTTGDVCESGVCVPGAEPRDCDDNNLCTVDRCDPVEGCIHRDISDLCGDDNPCTDVACDPLQGCIYPFNTEPCDDGNICTEGDVCADGLCRGTAVPVDDGNLCTDNACDPLLGVIAVPNTEPCDDDNACTLGDVCTDGGCEPGTELLLCDDANVCTDDFCDAESGCVFVPNTDPCDDGSLCTVNTVCAGGECTGEPVDCDDGNACTVNTCNPSTGCQTELVITNACRPNIVVDYPPRGAFITADGSGIVEVTGRVFSGAGDITSFRLNGEVVTPAGDGTFAVPVPASFGGNVLTFDAEDELGSTRERVQAFVYSDVWTPTDPSDPDSGFTSEGLGIVLGQPVFDQLTDILGGFINTIDLASLLGGTDALLPGQSRTFSSAEFGLGSNRTVNGRSGERLTFLVAAREAGVDIIAFLRESITLEGGEVVVTTPAIQFGEPSVALTVEDGALRVDLSIPDIRIRLRIERWGTLAFLVPTTTVASATALTATTRIRPTVVDGELVTLVDPVQAQLSGLTTDSTTLNIVLGFADLGLDSAIADALDDALPDLLNDVLGSLVDALSLELPLELPSFEEGGPVTTVTLRTALEDFVLQAPGFNAFGNAVDGTATVLLKAKADTTIASSYWADAPGSANRSRCVVGGSQALTLRREAELEVGLNDNTINALLHGVWGSGLLEQPLPESLFEGVDLTGFGVTRLDLVLDGMLPPVASDCLRDDGTLSVLIGDLGIVATVELLGTEVDLLIYVSAEATIRVDAGEEGIGIFLEEVDRVELEVNALDESQRGFEDLIGDLLAEQIEELLPSLFGSGEGGDDGALFTFALPEIDLSGLADGLEGGVLRIETLGAERLDGTSLIAGALIAVP